MKPKWAEYLISEVAYNEAGTHIDEVLVHPDYGDSVGIGVGWTRQRVIASLRAGTTFVTMYKRSAIGKWTLGAEVRIVIVEGIDFIRTDADKTKRDNLGNLPRF